MGKIPRDCIDNILTFRFNNKEIYSNIKANYKNGTTELKFAVCKIETVNKT